MFDNLKKIFSNSKYAISYLILVVILALLWYFFTDLSLMRWNHGNTRFVIDTIFSWLNILFFPLFIVAWIYRSYNFGCYQKSDSFGFIGGFVSAVISGSLCCGTSLLIPLGATIFVDFFSKNFKYWWLELKFIGVLILIFGVYNLLKNLTTCKMQKKFKNAK